MPLPTSNPGLVILHGADDTWLSFSSPAGTAVAHRPSEVLPVLLAVEEATRKGLHAAGFISYEAAAGLDPSMKVRDGCPLPLAWFGFYRQPRPFDPASLAGRCALDLAWQPSVSREPYESNLRSIKRRIADGDTYQVNYTFRLRAPFDQDPLSLFAALCRSQRTPYAAFLDTGDDALCSVSPELFFELRDGGIVCRPMKGTWARGLSAADDDVNAQALRESAKNRAENIMIVDMIRNDLGRIAETGSVTVRSLFDVERYDTLFQLTSTVSARTRAPFSEIVRALFPSASVTGAPKIKTMEIIAELETEPRGVYTGCIGHVAPDGAARFSVAIRTAHLHRPTGRIEYGTGGGITWDSDAAGEYEECCVKAAVLTADRAPFSLLETLLWRPAGGYFLLDLHLRRLFESARYFGIAFSTGQVREMLDRKAAGFGPSAHRVRLLVSELGDATIEAAHLPRRSERVWTVALAKQPVDAGNRFLFHKTTRREVYEAAKAAQPDRDDVILWNARGEVTESTIANVVARIGGQLVTPPVRCGLLPGVYRAHLLAKGRIREEVISRHALKDAEALFLINSVRGWVPARLA